MEENRLQYNTYTYTCTLLPLADLGPCVFQDRIEPLKLRKVLLRGEYYILLMPIILLQHLQNTLENYYEPFL